MSPELRGLNGEVKIIATVDVGGYVASAKVLNSSDERLNELAITTIERWKFDPAELNGKDVQSQVVQNIVFGEGNNAISTRRKNTTNDLLSASSNSLNPSLGLDDLGGLGLAQFEVEEDDE